MKAKPEHNYILRFPRNEPPTVEIDNEASAAYVRFQKDAKVAKTVLHSIEGFFAAVDLDDKGDVIGVEFVGAVDFTLNKLLVPLRMEVPASIASRTRYVPAKSVLSGLA